MRCLQGVLPPLVAFNVLPGPCPAPQLSRESGQALPGGLRLPEQIPPAWCGCSSSEPVACSSVELGASPRGLLPLALHSVHYKTPVSPQVALSMSLRARCKHLLDKKLPWSPAGSQRQPGGCTDISLHPFRGKTFTTR